MKIAGSVVGILLIALSGNSLAQGQQGPASPSVDERKTFRPISLSCPASKENGTLELISLNQTGNGQQIRVVYETSAPTRVQINNSNPGEKFHNWMDIFPQTETAPILLRIADFFGRRATQLKLEICEGTAEARRKYDQELEANKRSLQ